MRPDDHDSRAAMINQIDLLVCELNRIAASIVAAPVGERINLELMHERLSNLLAVLKTDLEELEAPKARSKSAGA
jgi:hypothetical protein